jgi:hypothetical protein
MNFEERIRSHQKPTDAYRWPNMTIGHLIKSIMEIHDEEDAKQFMDGYLPWLEAQVDLTEPPAYVAASNIGWCFGEGMSEEDREMWRKVAKASHPVFGSMRTEPSIIDALAAGFSKGANVR